MIITSKSSNFFRSFLVQFFYHLGCTACLPGSAVIEKAKEKIPHYFLFKRTDYTESTKKKFSTLGAHYAFKHKCTIRYFRKVFRKAIFDHFVKSTKLDITDSHARTIFSKKKHTFSSSFFSFYRFV